MEANMSNGKALGSYEAMARAAKQELEQKNQELERYQELERKYQQLEQKYNREVEERVKSAGELMDIAIDCEGRGGAYVEREVFRKIAHQLVWHARNLLGNKKNR
jgi:hypothetical protein